MHFKPLPFAAENFVEKNSSLPYSHGTTTLGFVYQGGVLISVDSRSTMGPVISSGSVKKVLEINPYLLGTMAGGAADCAFWERVLSQRCRLWELENGERVSVSAASKMLSNMLYQYKGYGLVVGTMIAGYDHTGPALFYVDSEGQRFKGSLFSVGSGSTYAYGVLDSEYRYDMTDEEAVDLGRRAIAHAGHRDAYSGNTNLLYIIKDEGWTRFPVVDIHEILTGQKEQ
ncbi:hypothetical protein RCL1_003639 [Eukaryota sp. TZLM3-RCL]